MDRRAFVGSLAYTVAMLNSIAAPVALAQARSMRRIGYLRLEVNPVDPPFWEAMHDLGWIEGRDVVVEWRYARVAEEFPALAAQLVALRVDVIIAQGPPAVRAAMQATSSIPILFWMTADPVENGLVASLARPGGNVTGYTYGKYKGKVLEVLKDALPQVSRVATPLHDASRDLLDAATKLGMTMLPREARGLQDLPGSFSAARAARADAVLFSHDVPWVNINYDQVAAEALSNRMPSIGEDRWFVEQGGLLAYGPTPAHWRRLAPIVDKVFNGVKPMAIPVELPTRFQLYINLKTANALAISIPKSLQVRADAIVR